MEELSKLPKQVQRTGYTRRIMDIMRNIEKQQITISGILKDTRETQKEINTASEVLPNRRSVLTRTHPGAAQPRCWVAPTRLLMTWCSAPPKRKKKMWRANERACTQLRGIRAFVQQTPCDVQVQSGGRPAFQVRRPLQKRRGGGPGDAPLPPNQKPYTDFFLNCRHPLSGAKYLTATGGASRSRCSSWCCPQCGFFPTSTALVI